MLMSMETCDNFQVFLVGYLVICLTEDLLQKQVRKWFWTNYCIFLIETNLRNNICPEKSCRKTRHNFDVPLGHFHCEKKNDGADPEL